MRYFIVFKEENEAGIKDDVFEVNDILYEILHDTVKDIIKDRPMSKEEEEMGRKVEDCPICGGKTEQIVQCPQCGAIGCVEICHPSGVGCICPTCEEKGMD